MCACLTLVAATGQAAPHIRLKGRAQLDVRLSRESGALVIAGAVTEDTAQPMPNARIAIRVASGADAQGALITLAPATPDGCRGGGSLFELDGPNTLLLQADSVGRFCTRLPLPIGNYVARVEAYESELVDGSKIEIPVDLRMAPVTLRFDPEAAARQPLSLDDESLSLEALASIEDEGVTSPGGGIPLALSNEAGEELGTARTDSGGHARFKIDPVRLGEPGDGELQVSFGGSETAGASRHAMLVERRTEVDLAASDARQRRLPTIWQSDDLAIRVVATPRCALHGCKKAPTGTIEARVDGKGPVGWASLRDGVAQLVLPFYSASSDGLPSSRASGSVSLRYIPDAPWFQPANEFVLAQALREPSPLARLPLAFAAIAVVAWLIFLRLPLGVTGQGKRHAMQQVQLVRPAPLSQGWTGLISDAHDALTIAGARVTIERPGFTGVEVLAETSSDANGVFALPPVAPRPRDELVAEAPLHARLRRPLPPSGELAVALVLRKRALLDRLVAWARRQGTPYDRAADPTPKHVREVAGENTAVGRWASALELAAYGGAVVDERTQGQVDSLAPPSEADDVDATHPRSL